MVEAGAIAKVINIFLEEGGLLLFPLRLKFKENFTLCVNHLNSIKTSNHPFQKEKKKSLLNCPSWLKVAVNREVRDSYSKMGMKGTKAEGRIIRVHTCFITMCIKTNQVEEQVYDKSKCA